MSQLNPSARLKTLSRWMRMAAESAETFKPEQFHAWADGLAQIGDEFARVEVASAASAPDPVVAYGSDRVNAVEAEMLVDSVHQLVKFLAYHGEQAATVAELVEIDRASSAIIDAVSILARGIARTQQPQNQTGA